MGAITLDSWLCGLIVFELGAIALCSFIVSRSRGKAFFFLGAVFLALSLLSLFSSARQIAAPGLLMPGSIPTRYFLFPLDVFSRRLLEPSFWLVIVSLLFASRASSAPWAYRRAAVCGVMLLLFESMHLADPSVFAIGSGGREQGYALHIFSTQAFLVSIFLAFLSEKSGGSTRRSSLVSGSILFALLIVVLFGSLRFLGAEDEKLLAGAHYYSWFPENWSHGYVAKQLVPPTEPMLGEYRSDDPTLFAEHVSLARSAGIDFFIFDFWPQRPWVGKRVYRNVQNREALGDMKFSLHYESLDLRERGDAPVLGETANIIYMTKERRYRLKKHIEHLAKNYMHHPSYLRFNGRPVLFMYVTRHIVGPVAEAIAEARVHVRETQGVDVYIVADEVHFHVVSHSDREGVFLRGEHEADWNRLIAFDAITSYNPYDSSKRTHAGIEGMENYVSDVEELYSHYSRVASALGQTFIPSVIPGYNDRALRLSEDHFVIPEENRDGESLFSQSLDRLVSPFISSHRSVFSVTSWNEWNEGTNIEPKKRNTSPTNRDNSITGSSFTAFAVYENQSCSHLETLTDYLAEQ